MLSAVCCGGSGCVEFRGASPAKSLSPSLSPDALELFSCPPSGGGIVHDGIGLPVKIPSGLRGCGGGIGSESGSVMPGKAELTLRSGVSGLGTPNAFPNWSPKAGPWPADLPCVPGAGSAGGTFAKSCYAAFVESRYGTGGRRPSEGIRTEQDCL